METARDLAHRGARVILACRNKGKAQKVAGTYCILHSSLFETEFNIPFWDQDCGEFSG